MESNVPSQQPVDGLDKWAGYTLDDLRYRRAVNHVKMEMQRERLATAFQRFSALQRQGVGSGIMKKVFTGFSIVDYAVLALQTTRQIKKIYRLFHR